MAASGLSSRVIVLLVCVLALFEVSRNFRQLPKVFMMMDDEAASYRPTILSKTADGGPTVQNDKTTVAYAVSMTDFKSRINEWDMYIDRAAVLHQSVKLAMQKSLRYNYHIYAFVHPDAIDAKPFLERLGYRVQIRDTPFNITAVPNFEFIDGQRISCCGAKEYLKLYSYLLFDYPAVVHLDLDTIVLRPMDEVFDIMAMSQKTSTKRLSADQVDEFARTSTMWMNRTFNASLTHSPRTILDTPEQINFMFTRDYNMVPPPRKWPYQIGVQGGFLVIRPNQRDFDRMIEVIVKGKEFSDSQWGGDALGYGDYYGASTIQGLASYYYDYHENATRSLELNRCKYNSMSDNPKDKHDDTGKPACTTREDKCEDCRETNLEDIYTIHLTECGKPEWCQPIDPRHNRLCSEQMREWHKIRLSLELEWINRFSSSSFPYVPTLKGVDPTASREEHLKEIWMGHCKDVEQYIPLRLPATKRSKNTEVDPLI